MADQVFNIALGRVAELYNRVDTNDPAASTLKIVVVNTTETDGTLKDLDTLALIIANANTAGYSRQELTLQTAGGQYTGAGFFGSGVEMTTVRRQYDQFLAQAVQAHRDLEAGKTTGSSVFIV